MRYEEIPTLERTVAEDAIAKDDRDDLVRAVLGAGLHEEDRDWAVEYCLRLVSHHDELVRGNAVLALGHIARRFGALPLARVRPIIETASRDASAFVRGHADSAADDIAMYVRGTTA